MHRPRPYGGVTPPEGAPEGAPEGGFRWGISSEGVPWMQLFWRGHIAGLPRTTCGG